MPPSEIEAIDWLQLWAVGRYALRLSDDDLSGLTFAEFGALAAQHRHHMRAADQRAAVIAMTIARVHGGEQTLDDFMPKTEHELAMERYAAMMNQLIAWRAMAARQQREAHD